MAYRNETKEMIRKMNAASIARVPCFFIRGNSLPMLETASLDLAATIENEYSMRFKGIVKHFTIKMPYFSDENGEYGFMERLRECVSIARDCYDSYCGLILIELDKEWGVRGVNTNFQCLSTYIRNNPQICFVIHALQNKKINYLDKVYFELSSSALWIQMNLKVPDSERCVKYFQNTAADLGYSLSDEVKALLPQLLEDIDISKYDVNYTVKQMIQQIDFDRHMQQSDDKVIKTEDIMDIMNITNANLADREIKIGFAVSR